MTNTLRIPALTEAAGDFRLHEYVLLRRLLRRWLKARRTCVAKRRRR